MTALNFLSPDGKCFTFDARANGYGRGEGVGFVVLKKLSDALRDNDPIRAVIKATHVNQDGRTAGITLPRKMAQVDNIRSVYRQAGLDFSQTGYVECHGTGTKAGDLTELTAVAETIASGRGAGEVLLVGSIKPNIGHLEGAAGIAGVIKAVLAAENAEIPPNANFEIGNPEIDFDAWKLKVSYEMETISPLHCWRQLTCVSSGSDTTASLASFWTSPSERQLLRLWRHQCPRRRR